MIPRVTQALRGMMKATPYRVIEKTIDDHEVVETTASMRVVYIVLQPMKSRDISVKPEGQRRWKWLDGWSQERLNLDWTVIDSAHRRFRIMGQTDWSDAGFYKYELVQGPGGPTNA